MEVSRLTRWSAMSLECNWTWVDGFDVCKWCACVQRFIVEIILKTNDLGLFAFMRKKLALVATGLTMVILSGSGEAVSG